MNHENINKVIDWLNRGAPEYVFSMRHALTTVSDTDLTETDEDEYGYWSLAYSERNKVTAGCGSVCCIGGAAAQFDGMKPGDYQDWTEVQDRALKYFGIKRPTNCPRMLAVFDPDLAPANCRPKQAAEALKIWASQSPEEFDINFNPWPELDEE